MRRKFFYLEARNGIWYAALINPKTGKRLTFRSTGSRDRKEAEYIAYDWVKNGIPEKKTGNRTSPLELFDMDRLLYELKNREFTETDVNRIIDTLKTRGFISGVTKNQGNIEFIEFLLDFWNYDKSEYVREKKAFGQRISRARCLKMTSDIENHWMQYFKGRDLQEITKSDLKQFIISLSEKKNPPLASKTINSVFSAGTIALKAAFEEGLIRENITAGVKKFSGKVKKRGILEDSEVIKLFSEGKWTDDRYKIANVLAATCGLRMGEIRALKVQDIKGNRLYISHSWCHIEGKIKGTKTDENRYVPLLPEVREALLQLIEINPFGDKPDNFIFFSWSDQDKPLYDNLILKALKAALYSIGIDEEERKERNITFHSWRHYFIRKMSDVLSERAMLLSGHKTRAVFEEYANHQQESDLLEAEKAVETVFRGILPEYTG